MKRLCIALTALALSSTAAFAGELTPTPEFDNFKPSRTRAEVRAEALEAVRSRKLVAGEALDAPGASPRSIRAAKTRAEVKAELRAYVLSGQAEEDRKSLYVGG